jgi:uncharacterized protein (TIGR02594 family)
MTNSAYKLAKQEIGTWEWEVGHNPVVLKYFDDVGHSWVNDDETPWCAAFIGSMLFRAGIRATNKLNARSYLDWGMPCAVEEAEEGDVVVFSRGDPEGPLGHVGFFVRRAGVHIEVLGGNQGDKVSVKRYQASRLLGVRKVPLPTGLQVPEAPKSFIKTLLNAILRLFR